MRSDCKTACILIDENDLRDLKNSYGYAISKESLWIPIDFFPMMQVILQELEESYYIPKVIEDSESSVATKKIYKESQKFLKQLLLANKIVDEIEESFPLEYFWLCIWIGVNRVISFCNDILNQYSIEEIVLIERNKYVNHNGLLISMASFTGLIEAFFKSKNVKVKILKRQNHQVKPRTIFYNRHGWKSFLRHALIYTRWKILSFGKKNHDYILVNPIYDNVINYYKFFKCSTSKIVPQAFHGGQIPSLHSLGKLLRFFVAKIFFTYKYSDNESNIIKDYKSNLYDFEFDFAKIFQSTIMQYLSDIRWMKNYINLFWYNCLEKKKRYLIIFSMPLVHLYSYFLMKETKKCGGKVTVWQHGGSYTYTDCFQHYVTDYKNADYFLSFGGCNIKEVAGSMGNRCATCVEVGSNIMYAKSILRDLKVKTSWDSQGLFVPTVILSFYNHSNIKWRGDLQFGAVKQIIDLFGSGAGGKVMVKGLKGHRPHQEIQRYINVKRYKYVSYADIPIDRALSNNPKFVILGNSSTPLLETLAQYTGPIFLMVSQKSLPIRENALALLKRRVIYSESVDELKMQLAKFFEKGNVFGVDEKDTSFIDVYLKKFSYSNYERFLQRATQLFIRPQENYEKT